MKLLSAFCAGPLARELSKALYVRNEGKNVRTRTLRENKREVPPDSNTSYWNRVCRRKVPQPKELLERVHAASLSVKRQPVTQRRRQLRTVMTYRRPSSRREYFWVDEPTLMKPLLTRIFGKGLKGVLAYILHLMMRYSESLTGRHPSKREPYPSLR